MKIKYCQIIALIIAVLMLAACAPSAAPSATPAAEPSQPQTTEQAPAPAPSDAPAEPAATPAPQPQVIDESATWDLTEYFADDAAFEAELKKIQDEEIPKYKELCEAVTDADSLLAQRQFSDELSRRIMHLSNYAQQKSDLNASDSQSLSQLNAVQVMSQSLSLIGTPLTNRLLTMSESFWKAVFADERLEPYWRELTKMRENAAYTLSDNEAALLIPANQALDNMQTTFSMLDYSNIPRKTVTNPDGHEVEANYNNYVVAMTHPDREYRKAFYEAFVSTYMEFKETYASNLNAYITLSERLARLHNFDSVLASAMHGSGLTVEIYDALMEAGRSSTSVLLREGEMRKQVMGLDELYAYDSRVAIGNAKARDFTYAEAQELIKTALASLGQDYVDTLDTAFNNRWIDVYPKENKLSGAYSGASIDIHPWVLTNYTDDYNSVSTLAHELGHAVHQYRSYASQQSGYRQNPPTLISEVASTCNQLLLSRYMIANAANDEEKLFYVQQELDTLRNTFFTQISFADFEREFHRLAENDEALTADKLNELYAKNCAVYSPAITPMEVSYSYWAAIPHFYNNYYVYSYAMAISVSCVVADGIANGNQEMLDNYTTFLSAGDSADAAELFKALGVDVTSSNYTEPLIRRYNELLDMEEQLLGL